MVVPSPMITCVSSPSNFKSCGIAEITVPVHKLTDKQEWFEIFFHPVDDHTVHLAMKWDMTEVIVPIKEANPESVLKIIEKLNEIKKIEKEAATKK